MFRSDATYNTMTDDTVAKELFSPARRALEKVRFSHKSFFALPMDAFCFFGCFRHLQGTQSMREHVQQLFHLNDSPEVPVARSTYSDALKSPVRLNIVEQMIDQLVTIAKPILPDRLKDFEEVSSREIYAVDGSYQKESAHYAKSTPKQGGSDNPKGHMMLAIYDVRMGAPIDVTVETQNKHEILVFKDYENLPNSRLRQRNALWVADRAFVDMPYWDRQNKRYGQTVITRMKSNLVVTAEELLKNEATIINEGVEADKRISLKASNEDWRLICYRTPDGSLLEFLTNDFSLSPGMVAFLYLRRWDEEKCFDTWKNDFSCGKAWSKSVIGIKVQALLAIMTSILLLLFLKQYQNKQKIEDIKCLDKQEKRLDDQIVKHGQRVPWYTFYYRSASKISRQVIRFIKFSFTKKLTQQLYEAQLKPLLLRYL